MSLEQQIQSLSEAIRGLSVVLLKATESAQSVGVVSHAALTQEISVPVIKEVIPEPVIQEVVEPKQEEVVEAGAIEAVAELPFSDKDSLVQWTISQYQSMSKEAQTRFPDLLTHFGISELSQLQPAAYQSFYQSVELLKTK
jgi:hypothetical protein